MRHGFIARCGALVLMVGLSACGDRVEPNREAEPSASGEHVRVEEGGAGKRDVPDAASVEADAGELGPPGPTATDAARGSAAPPDAQLSLDAPDAGTDLVDAGDPDIADSDSSPQISNDAGNTAAPAAPRCDDEIRNGVETDVDCGGPTSCARCGAAQACALSKDCLSGVCTHNMCTTPAYSWKTSTFGLFVKVRAGSSSSPDGECWGGTQRNEALEAA